MVKIKHVVLSSEHMVSDDLHNLPKLCLMSTIASLGTPVMSRGSSVTTMDLLFMSCGQRVEHFLNILQCPGQLSPTRRIIL